MVEAGVRGNTIKKSLNFGLSSICAAIISHSHLDHSKGCADIMKFGIDCYMTTETAQALNLSGHRLHIIEPMKQLKIDSWTILPFETVHDCPGSVGFLIKNGSDKLVFLTDTHYCPVRFKGLTIIAIECNWSKQTLSPNLDPAARKRLYRSHFNLDRVKQFLEANDLSQVKEIHLLHLSTRNSDEKLFKETIERLTGIPTYV